MISSEHGDVESSAIGEGFVQSDAEIAFSAKQKDDEDANVHEAKLS